MIRKSVVSSNLRSVGYDEFTNILEIEFRDSGIYQYFNIPIHIFIGLMSAASHGQYFNRNIKNALYRYRKIR